jgi:hypothetical protein
MLQCRKNLSITKKKYKLSIAYTSIVYQYMPMYRDKDSCPEVMHVIKQLQKEAEACSSCIALQLLHLPLSPQQLLWTAAPTVHVLILVKECKPNVLTELLKLSRSGEF